MSLNIINQLSILTLISTYLHDIDGISYYYITFVIKCLIIDRRIIANNFPQHIVESFNFVSIQTSNHRIFVGL